jgi:hypothetical protein
VAVGRAGEDIRLQALLAEFLLVIVLQVQHQRVLLRVLQAAEVVLAEARLQQLGQGDVEELVPVVLVDGAGEGGHLLVGLLGKLPAIGNRALVTSSILRSLEPARATIAAVSAARPSLPAGSWAEPAFEQQLEAHLRQRRLLHQHVELRIGRLRRHARPASAGSRCRPGGPRATAW